MFKHMSFSSTSFLLGALMVTSFGATAAKMSLEIAPNPKKLDEKVYTLVLEEVCNAGAVKVRSVKDANDTTADYHKFNNSTDAFLFNKESKLDCKKVRVELPAHLIKQGQNLQASTYAYDDTLKKITIRRDIRHVAIPCGDFIKNLVGIKTYEMNFDFQTAPACTVAKVEVPAQQPAKPAVKPPAVVTPPAAATSVQKEKEASVKLIFSKGNGENIRYSLKGTDVCKAEGYRFRVMNDKNDNRAAWYVTKGKERDTFEIPKSCSFDMTLSQEYIVPGKILHVKTVNRKEKSVDLVDVENLYLEIPCEGDIDKAMDAPQSYSLEKDLKSTKCVSATKQSQGGFGAQQQTQGPQQSCQASIKEVPNSTTVIFSASCSIQDEADIVVKQNGQVVFSERQYIGPNATTVVRTLNPRESTIAYTMEVTSVKTQAQDSKRLTLRKKATEKHLVTGELLSAEIIKPARDTSWGNYVWDTKIVVRVADGDLEEKIGDKQILVKLVNVKTDKVVAEETVATGQEVEFDLRAEYRLAGWAFWQSDEWLVKTLNPGTNKFKVLVYDAYQQKNFIELPVITVEVPKDAKKVSAD